MIASVFAAALAVGCSDDGSSPEDVSAPDPAFGIGIVRGEIGDVLPGTDLVAFADAEEAFAEAEAIADGLGPTFNDRGCGSCHIAPVLGGSGEQIEQRFGRIAGGLFFGYDSDEENEGGTLRQLFSNEPYMVGDQLCTIPVETEPASANVSTGRRTQPLFGLGLVDAMPDRFFDFVAAAQPAEIRGVVQRVAIALPDPRDPTQSIGSLRVGRFGWKGLVPSLLTFSGDAYDNEMGITTQSCFRGQTVTEFAIENFPNNVPPPAGCNGGDLAPAHTPPHPDVPEFTDDPVGPCTGGRTEIQDDLVAFTLFMESLAPPPRDFSDIQAVLLGGPIFANVGCAGCHLMIPFVTPLRPFNGVPGLYPFRPFSDFLLHDMGSLGDGIGQSGDPIADTRLMRTQPLWGARFNSSFLHDARAPDIPSAILAHDGQAAAARDAFLALPELRKGILVRYVLSL